jgi:hypothetical protein
VNPIVQGLDERVIDSPLVDAIPASTRVRNVESRYTLVSPILPFPNYGCNISIAHNGLTKIVDTVVRVVEWLPRKNLIRRKRRVTFGVECHTYPVLEILGIRTHSRLIIRELQAHETMQLMKNV